MVSETLALAIQRNSLEERRRRNRALVAMGAAAPTIRNGQRMAQVACSKGHDPEHVVQYKGRFGCRICDAERRRSYRERNGEEERARLRERYRTDPEYRERKLRQTRESMIRRKQPAQARAA